MNGNTPTSFREPLELIESHDFSGARNSIERLNDTNDKRWAYIQLIAEQVRIGDLEGAKETVHSAPVLWTGRHWVRCLLGPLVKSGDIEGAFEVVARLTGPGTRGFHKLVILALRSMAGDLSGARDTLQMILPEEGARDRALSIIVEAEVRRGDFGSALETACGIVNMDDRAEVIGTILAVQASSQGSEIAQRAIAAMEDESFRNQVQVIMEQTKSMKCDPLDLLSVYRLSMYVNDTFNTLCPPN